MSDLKKAQIRREKIKANMEESGIPASQEPTVYRSYSLPGGEGYREMLFLTPRKGVKPVSNLHWAGKEDVMAHMRFDERTDAEGNKVMHIAEIQSDWMNKGKKGAFKATPERRRESHPTAAAGS